MSLWGGAKWQAPDPSEKVPSPDPSDTMPNPQTEAPAEEGGSIEGERRESAFHRSRSLQSRVGQVLGLGLMGALAVGLVGWYYLHTFNAQGNARRTAQAASRNQAAGDAPLPALGPIDPPKLTVANVLGPPPPDPTATIDPPASTAPSGPGVMSPPGTPSPAIKSAADLALERRLAGPAFSRASDSSAASASVGSVSGGVAPPEIAPGLPREAERLSGASSGSLQELLKPNPTPAVRAQVLPTQRLLLPKGAFVDCTLETAIDSTLPGMTTCITATDTFSADGSTVLLERGTKLVGETRGEVAQGSSRVFVLWAEARTPTGVVIPLASPGTDELGRSGLAGNVNRHFFQRFGAAILISIIDGGIQAAVNSRSSGGTVIYNPSGSQEVMTEVLKDTINIRPTVTKNQGDRIQILVARDLDFRSVYELRSTAP